MLLRRADAPVCNESVDVAPASAVIRAETRPSRRSGALLLVTAISRLSSRFHLHEELAHAPLGWGRTIKPWSTTGGSDGLAALFHGARCRRWCRGGRFHRDRGHVVPAQPGQAGRHRPGSSTSSATAAVNLAGSGHTSARGRPAWTSASEGTGASSLPQSRTCVQRPGEERRRSGDAVERDAVAYSPRRSVDRRRRVERRHRRAGSGSGRRTTAVSTWSNEFLVPQFDEHAPRSAPAGQSMVVQQPSRACVDVVQLGASLPGAPESSIEASRLTDGGDQWESSWSQFTVTPSNQLADGSIDPSVFYDKEAVPAIDNHRGSLFNGRLDADLHEVRPGRRRDRARRTALIQIGLTDNLDPNGDGTRTTRPPASTLRWCSTLPAPAVLERAPTSSLRLDRRRPRRRRRRLRARGVQHLDHSWLCG